MKGRGEKIYDRMLLYSFYEVIKSVYGGDIENSRVIEMMVLRRRIIYLDFISIIFMKSLKFLYICTFYTINIDQ